MSDRSPHPLAIKLSAEFPGTSVLLVGIGSGRNLSPFLKSGHLIIALDESETSVAFFCEKYPQITVLHYKNAQLPLPDAAVGSLLSTHILQHGDRRHVCRMLAEFARVCRPGAKLALVFASVNDKRYGRGRRLGPGCYVPTSGDEIGVAHVYFSEQDIRDDLSDKFTIETLQEVDADTTAGAWAHPQADGLVHFFVEAVRR